MRARDAPDGSEGGPADVVDGRLDALRTRAGRGEFDVNRLVLNPDPLVSGKNFDISLPGTAQANCTGGEVQILVYLHGLHIYTTTKDLCGFTECPVKQGDVVIRYESSLPRLTPSGTYHVVMKATDTAGAPLLCLSVDLNIVFSLGYDKFAQELKPIEFQRVLAEM